MYTANFRGYIVPEVSGTYILQVSNVDDIVLFWYGDNAYSGWTRDNANVDVAYNDVTATFGKVQFNFQLTAGEYTPIRLMYANGGYGGSFRIQLLDPSSTVIFGPEVEDNENVVQYGCSPADDAPAFPAYGAET